METVKFSVRFFLFFTPETPLMTSNRVTNRLLVLGHGLK